MRPWGVEANTAQDDALVVLTTVANNVEAMAVRSVLESEGIHVFVQGENHRALEGALLGAFIELRVMVPRSELDDARELLEEVEYAEHLPPDEEPDAEDIDDPSIHRFLEDRPASDDEPASATTKRKLHPGLSVILAIMVPLGTGHFYARSFVLGALLAAAMLYCIVQRHQGADNGLEMLGIMMFDAIGGYLAARRYNARARAS